MPLRQIPCALSTTRCTKTTTLRSRCEPPLGTRAMGVSFVCSLFIFFPSTHPAAPAATKHKTRERAALGEAQRHKNELVMRKREEISSREKRGRAKYGESHPLPSRAQGDQSNYRQSLYKLILSCKSHTRFWKRRCLGNHRASQTH